MSHHVSRVLTIDAKSVCFSMAWVPFLWLYITEWCRIALAVVIHAFCHCLSACVFSLSHNALIGEHAVQEPPRPGPRPCRDYALGGKMMLHKVSQTNPEYKWCQMPRRTVTGFKENYRDILYIGRHGCPCQVIFRPEPKQWTGLARGGWKAQETGEPAWVEAWGRLEFCDWSSNTKSTARVVGWGRRRGQGLGHFGSQGHERLACHVNIVGSHEGSTQLMFKKNLFSGASGGSVG